MCLSVLIYKHFSDTSQNLTFKEKFLRLKFVQKAFLIFAALVSLTSLILGVSAITGYENKQIRFARDVQNGLTDGIFGYLPAGAASAASSLHDELVDHTTGKLSTNYDLKNPKKPQKSPEVVPHKDNKRKSNKNKSKSKTINNEELDPNKLQQQLDLVQKEISGYDVDYENLVWKNDVYVNANVKNVNPKFRRKSKASNSHNNSRRKIKVRAFDV